MLLQPPPRAQMTDESQGPALAATRTGMPPCPVCAETSQIEPLMQIDGVWHVRCLQCGYGFKITPLPPTSFEERRRSEERRAVARSGRRSTDLQRAVTCTHCGSDNVHGWIRTGEA